ncbi:MAG: hypothetical protein MUO82_10755 [Candidatus Thermoplasmatota archaeon]|nr:hypothetical protein [Candidatus Thermoplasmatota archaeon]
MSMKEKMIKNLAIKMGYDINNPKSIVYKTIHDTIITSQSFMTKKEIIDLLQKEINELE